MTPPVPAFSQPTIDNLCVFVSFIFPPSGGVFQGMVVHRGLSFAWGLKKKWGACAA